MRPGRFSFLKTPCLRPDLIVRKTFVNTPGAIFPLPEIRHARCVKMRTINRSPSGHAAPTSVVGAHPLVAPELSSESGSLPATFAVYRLFTDYCRLITG